MSASLFYHIVKGRLDKGERVDANFVLFHNGTTALTGEVLDVALNHNFDTVLTARSGADVHFCTIDQHDADRLHLRQKENGWVIENAPRPEEVAEQLEEGADKTPPLAVDLVDGLLKKGKTVNLSYRGKYGAAEGRVTSIEYEVLSPTRSLVGMFYINKEDGAKSFTDFGRDVFDNFTLKKNDDGSWDLRGEVE